MDAELASNQGDFEIEDARDGTIVFPAGKPGELFASIPSRYHWQFGGLKTKDTCRALFGAEPGRLTQIIPTQIWPLAEKLPGNTEEIVRRFLYSNTLYRIYAIYYGIELSGKYDLSATLSSVPRRTVGIADTKICHACVKDDFEQLGTPIVHLAHQAPGVRFCHRHRLELIDQCPGCGRPIERKNDLFHAPFRACTCGYMLVDESVRGAILSKDHPALKYSQFCFDLVTEPLKRTTREVVEETYRHRLEQLGCFRGERVSHQATMEFLKEYYGDELALIDIAYGNGARNQWLRLVHSTGRAPQETPIARHLLLSNCLFDSAQDFLHGLSMSEARLAETSTPVKGRSPKSLRDDNHYKQTSPAVVKLVTVLYKAIEENPTYTLKDLWRRFPGWLGALQVKDDEEFRKIQALLSERQEKVAERVVITERSVEKDRIYADTVRQTAIRLYAAVAERPKRINRSEMLRSAGLKAYQNNREQFPMCNQVMDDYAESQWHYWARRFLWTHIKYGLPIRSFGLRIKAKMPHDVCTELATVFSTITPPKVLRDGMLSALLGKYGIYRHWQGPCPGKNIVTGGRAHKKRIGAILDRPTNSVPPEPQQEKVVGATRQRKTKDAQIHDPKLRANE